MGAVSGTLTVTDFKMYFKNVERVSFVKCVLFVKTLQKQINNKEVRSTPKSQHPEGTRG